jgi:hypothetical protein
MKILESFYGNLRLSRPKSFTFFNVSTKKGGERASQNEHRSISASLVSPSGPNVCLDTALMHGMGMH